MGSLLYPRLPRAVAQSLILDRVDASLSDLAAQSSLSHPDAEPSATGGHPADSHRLSEVRAAIREIAERSGLADKLPEARTIPPLHRAESLAQYSAPFVEGAGVLRDPLVA